MRRFATVLVASTLAVVALAGCHSSSKSVAGNGTGLPTTSGDTPSVTDTPTTATDSTSPAVTTPTKATSPAPPPVTRITDECAFAQLGIRVLRGSGAQQREYASVFFTNTSAAACTMIGFPGISLRYQGKLLGQPAYRTSDAPAAVHLAPGDRAQADITDFTACQAPLSDTVRVYPPDSTHYVDLPLDLRGCQLSVKPVARS